ncbi:MAG TPA: peptidase C69 [Marinilabiliales bacterium]|jgi:dipeptidase|nr:MAG: peptidase C69 [Bacteroidetes bacterium GWA2_40_14]OFX60970.1 MAG: peptidase C69 [Bacteroidetes bacterium GWC2_40_13]OFX76176.1 MAG: peptidase C69 [Bacteroidetes bacterium GWD2_40_43]OFX95375.1 MAG: peptidase C69 [Bacteroidetes bacterium GWE2_40_63]OFY19038.1 MAG: peptidase C69 [Bacteroidetes bacterium GWF2_40_13]OFZ23980.1 MAG: peptidase C69 [Bacteroidetes bacterium RIFOXYC2_FULL_40_12]HAN00162.1 peptidase C69 [Marinilabiliales bacterium]
MKNTIIGLELSVFLLFSLYSFSQDKSDWVAGFPDGCTSITVGKLASEDGSVMTSHTDDSHRTRSEMNIVAAKDYTAQDSFILYIRKAYDSLAMPSYKNIPIGSIPQVKHSFAFINTAYPCMNEKQLGIGESTFGGHEELQSDKGLIDCQRLCQLMLERCVTAREAILLADDLTKKYGWNDFGECLTIADKKEVWHFEILGPGKDRTGAVWAAQRVPDDHVAVNANASTIKSIDLNQPDFFMASANIYSLAKENNWWKEGEPFQFCYVYAPESRESVASRRREWRVFQLLAPSRHFDPNDKDFPFSVKPDKKVSLSDMVQLFKDYYEGTPYDMTRNITTTNSEGEKVVSPLANPFMPYDQLPLHNIQGGWFHTDSKTGHIDFLGERTIARWYTMYGTVIQLRDWLPDEIGGVTWLALDNIATSLYVPVYAGTEDLPQSYKTPGRPNGFTRQSAWWAFNYMSTLAAQRWGEMRADAATVFVPLQQELFKNQSIIEQKALTIDSYKKRKQFLTDYTLEWGNRAVDEAWKLGDFFFTKYDEKF